MRARNENLLGRLQDLSPTAATTSGLLYLAVVGIADFYLPVGMRFMLLYLLGVAFIGWCAGPWLALAGAVFASGLSLVIEFTTVQPNYSISILVWNESSRFLLFAATGWLIARAGNFARRLSELVEERTADLRAEAEQHKATAAKLAETVERFEEVVNNITEVFWLSELPEHRVVYASPGYDHVWDRKRAEVYGDPATWLATLHPDDREQIGRRFPRERPKGGWDVEYRIIRPDGAVRWIRDRAFPVRNNQGEVYRLAGIAEDITERKLSRELLQTQAAILENMAEGVVVTDEQGKIVQMNPAAECIWGYPRKEVLGQPASVFSALPEPEAAAVMREVLAALQATGSWRGTFQNRRRDGAIIFCEAVISRLEVQGRMLMVAVEQDVTERLRAQERLQMQARVLESMGEAVLMTDEQGTIVMTNPALDALVGYEADELRGQPMHLLAGTSLEAHNQVFTTSVEQIKAQGSAAGDYLARRKDGTLIEVETRSSGVSVGSRFYLVVVGQDITERKRVEQALRQSEETLRVFLNAIPTPAMLLGRNGTILANNQALVRSLGLPTGELTGKQVFDFLPAEIAKTRKAVFDEVVRSRKPVQSEDARAERYFVNFASPVLDPAGNVTSVAVLALDITERKRAETVLAKQEELYRTLFELSPDGILLEDLNGNILDANRALCQSFGYSRDELLGQNVRYLVPPDGQGGVEAHLAVLRAGQKLEHEVRNVRKNGERRLMWLTEKPLALPDGRQGILVVARDVTESRRGELIKQVFLSLGTKLSSVRTPVEAGRTIYASADRLWKWDSATLSLYSRESDTMEFVLFCDVIDGQRRDVAADPPTAAPTARMRHIMEQGAQLILRREADMQDPESIRFGDVSRRSASIMSVPMRRDDQPVGVLSIQSYAPDAYTQEDVHTLQALADYCAGALERIRAEMALREAHDKLETRVQERTAELQAANAALRESEARLELALDASSAGTWSLDVASYESAWDDRYHSLYGFEPHAPRSFEAWITRVHPQDRERLQARLRALVEPSGNDLWNEEFRALHPVNGERWMASLGRVEQDQAGRAVRLAGINLDITERKHAEEAQRAQLAQIVAIYQSAPVGLCLLDTHFRYLQVNERLATINGLSVEEHLGRTVREAVPHLADGTEALCRQAVVTGQPVLNVELEGTTDAQPGVTRSWVTHWVPLKEPDGRVTSINVLVEETTEHKAMLRALQESEQKYRRLHESMTDAFVSVDMSGRLTEFNPAYQALLGYTADELRNLTYVDLTPEKWHALEARILAEQVLPRGYSEVYEKEYRRKDGTIFPIELRSFLIRDANSQPAAMWAIVRDITRRKLAEAALREAHDTLEARVKERTAELEAANAALAESEERYRSLVTNLNVGVYRNTPDPHGRLLHANPALARIYGYDSVEEFQSIRVSDTYREPGDRKEFLAELLRRGSVVNYELRLKKKDGTPIYGSVNAAVHRGPDGQVDWIDGVLEDITQRKRAEEALRVSEERYRALAESSPDAIFILNRDIRVAYVNSTAAALWRRAPEDLIGRTQAELFPTETAQDHSRIVSSVFETGIPVHRDKPLAFPVGDQWIEIRLAPLYDAQGKVTLVMGICRDITERKRAEQQLAEALDLNQKMIAASPMGISAYKASGECVFTNEALAGMVGGSPSEVLQDNFRRLEAWRESGLLQLAEEALSQGQARSGEIFCTTRFGKAMSLDCHLAPFVSNGQPHLLLMSLDIFERKRAEEALKMQSLVVQNMAEGTLLTDPDQIILFANSAMEAMFAYEPGELKGKHVSVLNAWSPEETTRFNQEVMRATEGGRVWHGQYQNQRKDGTVFTTESRVIRLALGGQGHFISVQQDITERKRAESLLQAQRDLAMTFSLTSDLTAGLKRLLEIAIQMGGMDSGGVYLLDAATGGLRIAVHHGVFPAFVKAVSYWAPDGPQMRLINRGRPIFGRFLDLPLPRDEVRRSEGLRAIALVPLFHEGKAIGALALTSHDSDEIPLQTRLVIEAIAAQAAGAIARIRAEEALRESETRLRAIITGAPVLLFAVDQDGIIRFEDGQGLKALGATRGANVGHSVMEVYAHLPTILENARRALRGEAFEAIVEAGPTIFDCWYSPTRDKDGKSTGYIGVATNISERHNLERQLLEISDREHARIGQDLHDGLCQHLVSLAFDANSLQGQLAAARRPEAPTARRIADYLDRAITETRQLSRGLFPVRMEKEGLPSALEELARATCERFGIPCRFFSKGPARVKNSSVATHLYRIAQEAVTNAVKHSRATKLSISLRARADHLELRVEDDGAGFSLATRRKATGMGLYIMDYRARTIGGTLRINPRRRGGTQVSCCVSRARQ